MERKVLVGWDADGGVSGDAVSIPKVKGGVERRGDESMIVLVLSFCIICTSFVE